MIKNYVFTYNLTKAAFMDFITSIYRYMWYL